MKRYILFTLLICCSLAAFAQRVVKGTVKSSTGPVPGASVFEKDIPGNGTQTDASGQFQLTLRGKGIIVAQSVGFLSKEIDANGKTQLAITLEIDAKGLEDVVVIGYGKKKRITNTGALAAVSGEEIRQTPSASLQNTLIGKVTGITTQQRSGQPGSDGASILIRGAATTGKTAPLVLIDDIEYSGALADIDPDQIETLTVLKDASTTAIYGIKGANGVILITTRRGKVSKPQLSLRSETGGQAPTFFPNFLGSYQSALLRNQARANDGLQPDWTAQDIQLFKDGTDPYGHPDINWKKVLLRPFSIMTNNTFNISGGTDKTKYFVSGGYLWQNGMVKDFATSDLNSNYYYRRYTFRSNVDVQATKDLLISLDLSGVFGERNEPNIHGRNDRNKVLFEMNDYVQLPPFAYALYNPNGTYGANPFNGAYSNNVIGRFALGGYNRSFDNDMTSNLRATQKLDFITKGLSIKGTIAYNGHYKFWRSMTRTNFPAYAYNPSTSVYTPFNANVYDIEKLSLGYYADGPNSYRKVNWQGVLNYDRTFGSHHVAALALINQTTDITGVNSPIVFKGTSYRLSYDFRQKYLVDVNAGYNGSSVFSTQKRYAWFPSASIGWVVSQEQFFKDLFPFIDLFKIRASRGLVGTDGLGNDPTTGKPFLYVYQQSYGRTGTYSIGDVSRTVNGIVEGTLGTDVTWEKERDNDVGVELKLFKGKLGITADYFDRYRYDILLVRGSVSNILGVGVPPVNLGKVSDKGWELEVNYAGKINQLAYSVRAIASIANNKILFQDEATPAYPWLSTTGHPLGSHVGYTWIGFYADSADIANSPKTPIAAKPGDLKYADLNKDGKIDPNDQRVLKYPNLPSTILGFTGSLNYKGVNLTFTLQSALNFTLRRLLTGNYTTQMLDAWTPTNNVNPSLPRLTTQASVSDYNSDFWYRRMDYLRVKSIELGYSFPRKMVSRLKLGGLRVYASGYNLFTWMLVQKNIYDFDPEAPENSEGGDYPVQKIVNLGIQLTF